MLKYIEGSQHRLWTYLSTLYPILNDVATDLTNPPVFLSANICPLPEKSKRLIPSCYKDLKPLIVEGTPKDVVFEKVVEACKKMPRWTLTVQDKDKGVVEGFATTLLLRFKDDFVIRISGTGPNVTVDMRSKSRLGKSDLGANAQRIMAYFKQLRSLLP